MIQDHSRFSAAKAYRHNVSERVERFLPMVRKLAWHLAGSGGPTIDVEDLMQAGLVAITECAQKHEGTGEDGFAAPGGVAAGFAAPGGVAAGGAAPGGVAAGGAAPGGAAPGGFTPGLAAVGTNTLLGSFTCTPRLGLSTSCVIATFPARLTS